MTHRLLRSPVSLVAVAASLLLSSPVHAAPGDIVYETVDAIEPYVTTFLRVTGVETGASGPTTRQFRLDAVPADVVAVGSRCDRFALLAMSKPGKYQFVMVPTSSSSYFNCKLILRTP